MTDLDKPGPIRPMPKITPDIEKYFIKATGTYQLDHSGKPTYMIGKAKPEDAGRSGYNCGLYALVDEDLNYWVGRNLDEAGKAMDDAGFEGSNRYRIFIPHTSDHGIWMRRNFDNRYSKFTNLNNVVDTLLRHGLDEEDALILSTHFGDVLKAQLAEGKTKNLVYKVETKDGRKVVVKFVKDKAEADIEALVNYEFSKDPLLGPHVARSDMQTPVEVKSDDSSLYLIVQEDISEKTDPRIDYCRKYGTREQKLDYLRYWARVLARFHVRGTEIMDALENHKPAQSLHREKDMERIGSTSTREERRVIEDIVAEDSEQGSTFIHSDAGHNKMGQFLIDWGNSGRGNPYLDLARLFVDASIQNNSSNLLNEDEKKHMIREYLQETQRLTRQTHKGQKDNSVCVTNAEVERAYAQYSHIEYLMNCAIGSYMELQSSSQAGDNTFSSSTSTSTNPTSTAELMRYLRGGFHPGLIKPSLVQQGVGTRRTESDKNVTYLINQPRRHGTTHSNARYSPSSDSQPKVMNL